MKRYFLSVILVAVFGGIAEELLPEGSTVRPHVRLAAGLCVLLVLVLPLKSLLVSAGELFGSVDLSGVLAGDGGREEAYESLFEGMLSQYSREEAGRLVGEEITRVFGLSEGTCRAVLTLTEEGAIERVTVFVSGTSILASPYEIADYVNGRFSCPCDVVVE